MKGETRRNRDEQKGVGAVMEIEWTWNREVKGDGWSGIDFVRDPSVIQYLTPPLSPTTSTSHLVVFHTPPTSF